MRAYALVRQCMHRTLSARVSPAHGSNSRHRSTSQGLPRGSPSIQFDRYRSSHGYQPRPPGSQNARARHLSEGQRPRTSTSADRPRPEAEQTELTKAERGSVMDDNGSSPRIASLAIGFGSGVLGACAGVGGALFIVPGLIRFCHIPQPVAAGTATAAVVAVSATSAASYAAADGVRLDTAAIIATAAAMTTPFGARLAPRINPARLRKLLGFFMILFAPLLPMRPHVIEYIQASNKVEASEDDAEQGPTSSVVGPANDALPESPSGSGAKQSEPNEVGLSGGLDITRKQVQTATGGAIIGFGAGLMGVGGGSLMTPFVAFLHPELNMTSIIGTSFAAMFFPACVAAASYYRLGLMKPRLVPPLIFGAMAGATVGSRIASAAPDEWLQWGLAVMLLAMGTRTMYAPLRSPGQRAKMNAK